MPATKCSCEAKFEADQENVLRYAVGSVPFKLLQKYKKKDTEVVDCLSEMAVAGEDSSFSAYTAEWTKAITRGGLLEAGDAAYHFFKTMKMLVKILLKAHVPSGTVPEAEIVTPVYCNEDVLFHWDLLTGSLSLDARSALLRDCVQLWVTICVNAFTRMVLEDFKHEKQVTTAKALRASLKQSDHDCMESHDN